MVGVSFNSGKRPILHTGDLRSSQAEERARMQFGLACNLQV